MSTPTPVTYNNLAELLADRDAKTPHDFGRNLYKYTSCGPWTQFLIEDRVAVYYEDLLARTQDPDQAGWWGKCIGIRIGSIVEGSDAEIVGDDLPFPFTDQDLEQTIQYVNAEASAAWDEANTED